MNSKSGAAGAPKACVFCATGEARGSRIQPLCPNANPEDLFCDILSQIIDRGFCTNHPGSHNVTDYKYLNGAKLKKPTKRDRELYLDLFQKGYTFSELVQRNPNRVKDSIITPICNVLAWGYKLDLEQCGIPISNEMEESSIQAIYAEVFERKTMPFRFSAATESKLPKWPFSYFIYAKLRGKHTRTMEPELMCRHSGSLLELSGPMPVFCECGQCKEDICNVNCIPPVQGIVITPAQRERTEANRQAALARRRIREMEANRQPELARRPKSYSQKSLSTWLL